MSPILQIIIGVASAIIAALILYILKFTSLFFKKGLQPKIQLTLSKARHSGHPPINGRSPFTFKARIELFNNSENTAYNISIIDYSDNNPFKNSSFNQSYLESLTSQRIETDITKYYTNDERNNFIKKSITDGEYLPEDFDYIALILKYTNSKDKPFYTKFIKSNDSQINSYHCFKPRIKKSP